jgi:hypothetical protein
LRRITQETGSLLIFDEVMTGFRLALGGAQQVFGIDPDLTCLGKIIGGGVPCAAFGGKAGMMNMLAPLGPVYQAGTLSGNPLAMAAGIATLRTWPPMRAKSMRAWKTHTATVAKGIADAARDAGIPDADQPGRLHGYVVLRRGSGDRLCHCRRIGHGGFWPFSPGDARSGGMAPSLSIRGGVFGHRPHQRGYRLHGWRRLARRFASMHATRN